MGATAAAAGAATLTMYVPVFGGTPTQRTEIRIAYWARRTTRGLAYEMNTTRSGGAYQLTRLGFDKRDQAGDIHLARSRVRAALDANASGNALIQYNSTTDRLALNLRLRYNFAEGTDLWLVYDEALSTERLEYDAGLRDPLSAARTLIVKYSHTFRF